MKKIILLLILGIFIFSAKGVDAFTVSSYEGLQICNSDNCNGQQKATSLFLHATVGWIGIGLSKSFDLNLAGYNMPSTFQLPVGQIAYSQNGDVYGAWNIIYSGLADSPPADGQLYPFAYGREGDRTLSSKLAVSNPSGQGVPTLTTNNPNVVNCNQWGCWGVSPGSAYVSISFSPVWVNIRGYIEEWIPSYTQGRGGKTIPGYWKWMGDNTVGRSYQLPSIGYTIYVPPGPPSNLKATCAADGNSVTLSWDNQPGYNRVYFRNYDATAGYNYAWNDDVWGSSTVVGGLTHGHTYSWWIHTRADSGAYSDAVVGTYTCSPTTVDQCNNIDGAQASVPLGMTQNSDGTCSAIPVDQCTNVSGIQASIPTNANKNTDGTCSCSASKHFEGALCVDDTPLVSTFSVSCSVPSIPITILGDESKFTATVQNNTGLVSYKWKEKDNATYISGANNSIFERTYSTVGSHRLYVEATDDNSTVTNFCTVTVDCDASHYPGEKVCDATTGIESTWSCTSSGWNEIKTSCSIPGPYSGPTPEVGTFTFTPDIVADTSGKCGLNLSATNVSSCTLTAPGATPVVIPGSGGVISKLNDKTISIGRYNLSCTGMGVGAVTKQFGFKTCLLNADVRER